MDNYDDNELMALAKRRGIFLMAPGSKNIQLVERMEKTRDGMHRHTREIEPCTNDCPRQPVSFNREKVES